MTLPYKFGTIGGNSAGHIGAGTDSAGRPEL